MASHVHGFRARPARALLQLVLAAGAVTCLTAAAAPTQPETPRAQLNAARTQLVEHFSLVQSRCHCAGALQTRLDSELARLPSGDPASQSGPDDPVHMLASLESNLVTQLVAGQYRALNTIQDSGTTLVASKSDGSVQPLSVFVPAAYGAPKSFPLVIVLHGADQSENELLAIPELRRLANATGAVLALPWARGDDIAGAGAANDVYDALDAVETAFSIDRRRVYLAGISLGGIAIFGIAPLHAERWRALLSIAGTLTNDELQPVARNLRGKQVFLVAGGSDNFVKPAYVKAAAAWLNGNGIESHYYEQPGGDHSFSSLDPSIERAWRDMLSGVRLNTAAPDIEIPTPAPAPSQKN
jgi:acetyl esterase/lipase